MALDYQKHVYGRNRPNTRKRTTYGLMNSWRHQRGQTTMGSFDGGLPSIAARQTPGSRSQSREYQSMPAHMNFYKSSGQEDVQGSFQRFQSKGMNPTFPLFGTPRMRYGRAGGSWRHVREVVQARGPNTIFVDGNPKMDDNSRLQFQDLPYGNVIQPSATCKAPIKVAPSVDFRPNRHRSPVYNTAYAMDSYQGTDKHNWMIVR